MTIQVKTPDGGTAHFPDGTDPAAMERALREQFGGSPAPDMSAGEIAADVAKSGGIGVVKGGIGLAGLPRDAINLGETITNAMPIPDSVKSVLKASKYLNPLTAAASFLPGSQDIQSGVESVTGEFYKPKSTAGEYAQTAGEVLPSVIGGPETLGMKLATRVAVPAIASETAGQLTKGTDAEPYARVAGGVAGGLAAAKSITAQANRAAQKTIPTGEDLLNAGSKGFDAVLHSGATIDPNDAIIMAQGIKAKIFKEGARPASQPALFSELDRLEGLGMAGKPVDMGDMESIRKALVDLKKNPDGGMRTHAKAAVSELMDLQAQVLPQGVSETLKDAIGNWAAGKRSNTVMGKAALGELNADTAGAGGNLDNASRQAIKQLVRPINNDIVPQAKRLGFNDAEVEQMNTAARGTLVGNTARFIGKAAPTGIVSGSLSGGAGFAAAGPAGAVALPAVGYIAKKIGDMSTQRQIQFLDSMVRSRSPLAAQVAQQLPQVTQQLPASTQALLSALMASAPARNPPVQTLAQGGG